MAADFYIKQGDTSPAIEAQLEDEAGNPVDLTGASVDFHMKAPSATGLKVDAAGTIFNQSEGKVRYEWASGDTDTTGLFHAEWEVAFGDGSVETFPNTGNIEIEIVAELG